MASRLASRHGVFCSMSSPAVVASGRAALSGWSKPAYGSAPERRRLRHARGVEPPLRARGVAAVVMVEDDEALVDPRVCRRACRKDGVHGGAQREEGVRGEEWRCGAAGADAGDEDEGEAGSWRRMKMGIRRGRNRWWSMLNTTSRWRLDVLDALKSPMSCNLLFFFVGSTCSGSMPCRTWRVCPCEAFSSSMQGKSSFLLDRFCGSYRTRRVLFCSCELVESSVLELVESSVANSATSFPVRKH